MKQRTGKYLLSVLLTLAMVVGLLPGMSLTAYAAPSGSSLDNPFDSGVTVGYASLVNTTTVVNFDGKEWYLIENNSTAANAGTVTLLSKECVAASQYNYSGSYVEYASSTVKTAVDNYYTNSISSNAKTAVVDNEMFLLTTEQANAITNAEVRKCSQASGASYNYWWLCSRGYSDSYAACVLGRNGNVNDKGTNLTATLGVRPALKLNLSSVIFSSNTFTVGSATVDVTGVSLDKTAAQTIEVNGKVSFTATVAPDGATDKTVKWSVGGTDAGAVKLYTDEACTTEVDTDATDKLTVYAKGISAGSATVTVTSNADANKSASCDVTVNESHTVTFNANGGIGTMEPQTITGEDYLTANAFTRSGQVFTGWNTKADGTGDSYSDGDWISGLTSDITLYAQWIEPNVKVGAVFKAGDTMKFASQNQVWVKADSTLYENHGAYSVKISAIEDQQVTFDGVLYRNGEFSTTSIGFENSVEGANCVKVTSGSGTKSDPYILELAVYKDPATVTKAPTAKTLTYTGQAQELVTAGTAEGGTMNYALGENATTVPTTGYTTSIPTKTDAGT